MKSSSINDNQWPEDKNKAIDKIMCMYIWNIPQTMNIVQCTIDAMKGQQLQQTFKNLQAEYLFCVNNALIYHFIWLMISKHNFLSLIILFLQCWHILNFFTTNDPSSPFQILFSHYFMNYFFQWLVSIFPRWAHCFHHRWFWFFLYFHTNIF
jgi:hypothetical protein